jgi:hypothetical protein
MFNAKERHFSVADIAANLNLSADTIRKLFRDEPGVIIIENPRRGCRTFQTLRIPESVAQRVYERLTNQIDPVTGLRLRKRLCRRFPYRGGAR